MKTPSFLEKLYHRHVWTQNREMNVWLMDNGYEASAFRCVTSWCPAKKEEPWPEAADPFPVVGTLGESYDWSNVGRAFTTDSKGRPVERRRRISNS